MAVPAASAKSVIFGPLGKYMIRQVRSLAVLRLEERYADYGQVGFLGFSPIRRQFARRRHASRKVLDPAQLKKFSPRFGPLLPRFRGGKSSR